MKRIQERILNAANVATSVNSPIFNCGDIYVISLVTTVTGTPSASIKFQASNDEATNESGAGVTNWADIGSTRTLSAAGTFADNIDGIGYKWVRVVLTGGGTGTITATVNAKGA
jgi:hypothetical protein